MEVRKECRKELIKAFKKNPELNKTFYNKLKEILEYPYRFKPLKNELFGRRRVHLMKSFVLQYEISETEKKVTLLSFKHHDFAYEK